jgi:hypothetical protein
MFITEDWIVLWKDTKGLHLKEFNDPFAARDWKNDNRADSIMLHVVRW